MVFRLGLLGALSLWNAPAQEPTPPKSPLFIGSLAGEVYFTGEEVIPVGSAVYLHIPRRVIHVASTDGTPRDLSLTHSVRIPSRVLTATISEHGSSGHPSDHKDQYRHGKIRIERYLDTGPLPSGGPFTFSSLPWPLSEYIDEKSPYFLVTTKAFRNKRTVLDKVEDAWHNEVPWEIKPRIIAALTELSNQRIVDEMESYWGFGGTPVTEPPAFLKAQLSAARLMEEFGYLHYRSEEREVLVAALKRYQLPKDGHSELKEITFELDGRQKTVPSKPVFSHVMALFSYKYESTKRECSLQGPALVDTIDDYRGDGMGYLNEYSPKEFIDNRIIGIFDALDDGTLQLLINGEGAESSDVHILLLQDGKIVDPAIHYAGGL